MQSLTIVSNRLPVTVGETIEKSSGGMVSALEGLADRYDLQWIGWAGGEVTDPGRKEEIAAELKERFNFTPIFLSHEDAADYYTGFSNSSLWPLLHHMPTKARYEERWFDTYRKVNRVFADAVLSKTGPGDLVWIQDYHLMLLPKMLREQRPEMTIGFFLHTPFPSSEIFRCHPDREALVEGLLGADRIGFHTFGYLRHFRSTVLRLLGIESQIDAISSDIHRTGIGVYPIGIHAEKFRRQLKSEGYERSKTILERSSAGRKIVLSVERLDYTKGVPRRLDAIERFLADTGRTDVVFIFVCVPSRESVPEYQELRRQVELKVSRINGKHSALGNIPVHFIHRPVAFEELCALYAAADVAAVTPLMDGMNLVAKEYLMCQQEKAGALVLSEFSGAAQELHSAYLVNPYNVREIADALQTALEAPEAEKQRRLAPMRQRVAAHDARHWAESFIKDLTERTEETPAVVKTRPLSLQAARPLLNSRNAALFLDYDGTLAELKPHPADAAPVGEVERTLSLLHRQGYWDVYLMGGRGREEMANWFSGYRFHLIAEHGYCFKKAGDPEWAVIAPDADLSWKDRVVEFLELYAETTPGSFLQEKTASVVWHYGSADPEFGAWKAHQLVSELQEMLSNLPVEIHHGRHIVEVGSMLAGKGGAVSRLVTQNGYDAALCAGDDETDEAMFRLADDRLVTVKVGRECETAAAHGVLSPKKFRAFLEALLSEQKPAASGDA